MLRFGDFLLEGKKHKKKHSCPIIPSMTHGSHAQLEPAKLVTTPPVHGSHSLVKEEVEHKEHDGWVAHAETYNSHLGSDHREVDSKLHIPEKEYNNIPGKKHVDSYTSHSRTHNEALIARAKGEKPKWTDKSNIWNYNPKMGVTHAALVKGMDKATNHKPLEHDLHVFHGAKGWNPGELAAQHPEGHIKSAAFLSTSIKPRVATSFSGSGNHIIHIHMKKGQKGLYVGRNSAWDMHNENHEHEFILPRNSTLKIHPKPDKITHSYSGYPDEHTHVWHAEVVHQDHP